MGGPEPRVVRLEAQGGPRRLVCRVREPGWEGLGRGSADPSP